MKNKAQIYINLSHLVHNVRLLKKHLGPYFFCPVVKANAYGHGLSLVVPTLENENIHAFCVSSVQEGIQVRSLLKQAIPILVFTADYNIDEIYACFDSDLTPVIGQMSDLLRFKSIHKKINIHLKFNTGLNCYGFSTKEANWVKNQLYKSPYLNLIGVATHLAKSYDAGSDEGCTALQQKEFSSVQKIFGHQNYHYQNSACLLLQGDIGVGARPGIALYGVIPPTYRSVSIDLKPVMSFETQLINIRKIEKGACVSYEHQWKAKRPSTIGLIPIGYADGLRRYLKDHQIHFLIEGQKVAQIGVIRMNCCLVDLTDLKANVQIGTKVVILGISHKEQISAQQLAYELSITPYELLTGIRSDIVRIPVVKKTVPITHDVSYKNNLTSSYAMPC